MKRKCTVIIIVSYLVLMLSAYSVIFLPSNSEPGSEKVVFTNDFGLGDIIKKYADLFEDKNYQLSIQELGQELGDVSVLYGSHLNMLKSDGYLKNVISADNVIVTVSKRNPLSSLSESQLSDILSGKINTWKGLNGNDGRIIVVSDEGTYRYLAEKFDNISSVNIIHNADVNYFAKDDEYVIQIIHVSLFNGECKAVSLENAAPDDYKNYPLQDPVILAYKSKYNDIFTKY